LSGNPFFVAFSHIFNSKKVRFDFGQYYSESKTVSLLKKVVGYKFGWVNFIITMMCLFFYWRSLSLGIYSLNFFTVLGIIISIAGINATVISANILFSKIRYLWCTFSIILIFFYGALHSYKLETKTSLDYSTLRDNISLIIYPESISFIVGFIGASKIAILLSFILILIIMEIKGKYLSRQKQPLPLMPKFFSSVLIYTALILSPVSYMEEGFAFFKSLKNYYSIPVSVNKLSSKKSFISLPSISGEFSASKPDIFLLLLESFNANFVESRTPDGREYTPFFNSLIRQGLYVEHFYGNSMQTAKGQFATLFSVVPSIKGKVFVHFSDRKFRGLASILKDNGYRTIFFQANRNLDFDNTRNFLSRNGFEIVETVASCKRKGDEKYMWGWGMEDDVFYRRFFEYLDSIKKNDDEGKRPLFITLATVMNHPPFNMVPLSRRLLYLSPKTREEYYANSVRLMDEYLKVFFDELRSRNRFDDAIIIITGDHSYPVGEHGYYGSEESFYSEFFRTPFLLIWKEKIKPARISDAAYSQMDIGPTILHLTGLISEKNHFQGVSIFDSMNKIHPVYLIQPYSGRYLSVVFFPYKYTLHVSSNREYLFDILKDPRERRNLIRGKEYFSILTEMRERVKFIFENQINIEKNSIWRE